ncbi:MAG: hypothetical protein K9L02_00435 [Acholeplasmataceae bacterium]|nr:hypothetical protein [Acholeplasmataceae bacterium]
MLNRINQSKIAMITVITGIILVFDILTIITNIYIAPVLEGFGLPDILIYMKTLSFLLLFIILVAWLKNKDAVLTRSNLKIVAYISFALLASYFLSLFMYKYVLILETASIIKNQILQGNPVLVFDFSAINYKTLTYITTIFSGFNSEIILFAEALVFQLCVVSIGRMTLVDEPNHVYDPFLFDNYVFPLFSFLILSSFLSINLFLYRFDTLGSIEMVLALTGFTAVLPGLIPSFTLYTTRHQDCTRTFFKSTYQLLLILSIVAVVVFLALTTLNIYLNYLGRGSYRTISSSISLILAVVLLFRTKKMLYLENK